MFWLKNRQEEDRALSAPQSEPSLIPYTGASAPLDVTTANALRVSDAYACIRVLADSVSSLPLHVYRRTAEGRVPAGENARAVQLLMRPSPGSTSVDLVSQIMVHLQVYGECFVGKYRADGEIVQLGLLHPEAVEVELRGQRIVYVLDTVHGRTEHGPGDVLHIKGMSLDGLRGLSPVAQCRVALGLSSALHQSAKNFTEQGSRPSGILSAPGAGGDAVAHLRDQWAARHGGVQNFHKVAVLSGDVKFTPMGFSGEDAQFLQQREFSTREIARI